MSLENYECDGQMNIFDFLPKNEPIYDVDIRGLCDDAYCPKCGYSFKEWKGEVDLERCPQCRVRVDWNRWHTLNDDWWLKREET